MTCNADGIRSRVYFAQALWGGPIKIGSSFTVEQRLRTLAGPLPFDLVEIGSFYGDTFQEKFLHCVFAKYRIRGEWFQPVPELWRAALESRTCGALDWVPATEITHCAWPYADIQHSLEWHDIPVDEFVSRLSIERATFDQYLRQQSKLAPLSWLASLAACLHERGRHLRNSRVSHGFGSEMAEEAA